MTGGEPSSRSSTDDKRQLAREKAKELRDAQRKKDRRSRWALQGGIVVVVLAIIAGVTFVIVTAIRPPSNGPANMAADGIVIGQGLQAIPSPALAAGAEPQASETDPGVPNIRIYLDYLCPLCGEFEQTNREQLAAWAEAGTATVEFHPIAALTGKSAGTQYSLRAANAAACVANYSPDHFFDFNVRMLDDQPEEGSSGLTDEQIIEITRDADVEKSTLITTCINEQKFKPWVQDATERALGEPVPNSSLDRIQRTPTVLVNDKQYAGALDDDQEFQAFVLSVASETYAEATATPTPTPTATEPAPEETPAP
ncbi:hypothetical protein GCM10027416_09280 [Okibacterium endophyticum]